MSFVETSPLFRHEQYADILGFPRFLYLFIFVGVLDIKNISGTVIPSSEKLTFSDLPAELRIKIWHFAAPDPRVIFQHAGNNNGLPLLGVNRESRIIAKRQYTPVHLPSPRLAHSTSEYFAFLYVDLKRDTVVRDISQNMNPRTYTARTTSQRHPLFREVGSVFTNNCIRHFWGLARVENLTLSFNMERDTWRILEPMLYCCPSLKILNMVPESQLGPGKKYTPVPRDGRLSKLLPVDHQLMDYVDLRVSWVHHRKIRVEKASRAARQLSKLHSAAKDLKDSVLPWFINEQNCASYWNPQVRVCIVASWVQCSGSRACCSGWHSRYLSGDSYSREYVGDDGLIYKGFLESLTLMGENFLLRNRYEGVASMFEEVED